MNFKVVKGICFLLIVGILSFYMLKIGVSYSSQKTVVKVENISTKVELMKDVRNAEDTLNIVQKLSVNSINTNEIQLTEMSKEVNLSSVEEDIIEIDTNNLLFIGNSLVDGLKMVSTDNSKFISKSGIDLKALKNKGYIDKLYNYSCDTVLIEMGTNELGWYTEEEFKNSYIYLINKIREINPKSNIICISIPPVSANKSASNTQFNNSNVIKYNQYIKDIVGLTDTYYLDCSDFFGNVLSKSMTSDGIHLVGKQYANWYNFILEKLVML